MAPAAGHNSPDLKGVLQIYPNVSDCNSRACQGPAVFFVLGEIITAADFVS